MTKERRKDADSNGRTTGLFRRLSVKLQPCVASRIVLKAKSEDRGLCSQHRSIIYSVVPGQKPQPGNVPGRSGGWHPRLEIYGFIPSRYRWHRPLHPSPSLKGPQRQPLCFCFPSSSLLKGSRVCSKIWHFPESLAQIPCLLCIRLAPPTWTLPYG